MPQHLDPKPQEWSSGGHSGGQEDETGLGDTHVAMTKCTLVMALDMETVTDARPAVVVHACCHCNSSTVVTATPALKVDARGSGVQSQPLLQESQS